MAYNNYDIVLVKQTHTYI